MVKVSNSAEIMSWIDKYYLGLAYNIGIEYDYS